MVCRLMVARSRQCRYADKRDDIGREMMALESDLSYHWVQWDDKIRIQARRGKLNFKWHAAERRCKTATRQIVKAIKKIERKTGVRLKVDIDRPDLHDILAVYQFIKGQISCK